MTVLLALLALACYSLVGGIVYWCLERWTRPVYRSDRDALAGAAVIWPLFLALALPIVSGWLPSVGARRLLDRIARRKP